MPNARFPELAPRGHVRDVPFVKGDSSKVGRQGSDEATEQMFSGTASGGDKGYLSDVQLPDVPRVPARPGECVRTMIIGLVEHEFASQGDGILRAVHVTPACGDGRDRLSNPA